MKEKEGYLCSAQREFQQLCTSEGASGGGYSEGRIFVFCSKRVSTAVYF